MTVIISSTTFRVITITVAAAAAAAAATIDIAITCTAIPALYMHISVSVSGKEVVVLSIIMFTVGSKGCCGIQDAIFE